MITKPCVLSNVTGLEIYGGGWQSEYTNRLGRDMRIFKKLGQRFAWRMQHLGETAQNGVFWGQEIVTLSAARVRIWGGPENLKEEEAKAESQRLFREILRWSVYFRRKRYNDWWCGKYIHKYKSANLEDPHGYV